MEKRLKQVCKILDMSQNGATQPFVFKTEVPTQGKSKLTKEMKEIINLH
jgi:hypothetical protein